MSSVFQYIVLYTLHQPQYLVVSNGAMNLYILHKCLRYNILWLIMHSYTIYRHAVRSARFAVSRALCIYRCSLPAACRTCDTAQLSPARAMLRTAAVAVQRTAHDTAYSLNYVQIAQKTGWKIAIILYNFLLEVWIFFCNHNILCSNRRKCAIFSWKAQYIVFE